jgi:outer membrane lipoprotein SlyB
MKRVGIAFGIALAALTLTGCATHHQVTDPASGKVYYTKDLDTMKNGAVRFTDGQTGSTVTVQNSEVKQINEKTYKSETRKD